MNIKTWRGARIGERGGEGEEERGERREGRGREGERERGR